MKDFIGLAVVAVLAFGGLFWGYPHYRVWQQGLSGQASLERAKQDRQIAVQEAEARLASAGLDAKAEIARATGSAEANRILTESLGSEHADRYLQLRYIQVLENSRSINREVIYVPNGMPIPITEAGRATTGLVPSQ